MNDKSERRWLVRQTLIATNLLVLGIVFYADYNGAELDAFKWAVAGFNSFTTIAFVADYATKPRE